MKKLAILGASGHGRVVVDTALQIGWDEIVFFDDAWPASQNAGQYVVIGDTSALLRSKEFSEAVVAIGDNKTRLKKTMCLFEAGFNLPILVHPMAYVADDVCIDIGTVIFAGCVVQSGSALGQAVIVNTGATIDHDCVIGAGAHISPGAHLAGGVSVGQNSWIGIGASINQCLKVGSSVTVGAGAAVIENLEDDLTVVGVPARVISGFN